jgi:hypothetical protein
MKTTSKKYYNNIFIIAYFYLLRSVYHYRQSLSEMKMFIVSQIETYGVKKLSIGITVNS